MSSLSVTFSSLIYGTFVNSRGGYSLEKGVGTWQWRKCHLPLASASFPCGMSLIPVKRVSEGRRRRGGKLCVDSSRRNLSSAHPQVCKSPFLLSASAMSEVKWFWYDWYQKSPSLGTWEVAVFQSCAATGFHQVNVSRGFVFHSHRISPSLLSSDRKRKGCHVQGLRMCTAFMQVTWLHVDVPDTWQEIQHPQET